MKTVRKKTEKIVTALAHRGETVTFAESCTGGRIVAEFTAIPGVSSILSGSCITYSNEIKHRWLGVEKKVLETYGAVSKECISQMLDGIINMTGADYGIAVSGIAGPTGDTKLKPIGTVYIGLLAPDTKKIYHCSFRGNRENIQKQSVIFAITKLAELLNI
ncbi:MAG: CinA family protein [Sulfurovum sp.]|nr:CinA family protein [Sulfurovum sp.]MCB4758422.1 CinA family protein [Sulfurovum sp.]MCB4764945.1 CinA family protein [Sulfurovum sp.]MCB4774102.1 CinA family protein [Sulfurovum sp.]